MTIFNNSNPTQVIHEAIKDIVENVNNHNKAEKNNKLTQLWNNLIQSINDPEIKTFLKSNAYLKKVTYYRKKRELNC